MGSIKENIIIEELPSLPVPLAHLSASIIGEKVYVAGGENLNKSTNYFSLNISNDYSLEQKWLNYHLLLVCPELFQFYNLNRMEKSMDYIYFLEDHMMRVVL